MSTAATENNDGGTSAGPWTQATKIRGEDLADKVKKLLHEGNVRRITIRNDEGHTIIEIPVTAGVVAAVAAPVLVGVAAIAALAGNWGIEIDRAPLRTPTTDGAAKPKSEEPAA